MKIDKRNEIFGETLGTILAAGSAEVSEKEFAPNIYKIDDEEARNKALVDYIRKLSEHAKPSSTHHSTCERLITRLQEESQKHQDSSQKLVKDKINELFHSQIGEKKRSSSSSYSLENIQKMNDLSKMVLEGKAVMTELQSDWLKEQTRSIRSIGEEVGDVEALNTVLQTVKKYSKEIAATSQLPYTRISSNIVSFPEQTYIMTACPDAAEDQKLFWDMVIAHNAAAIVAVLIPNEKEENHELAYCNSDNFPADLAGGWVIKECTREILAKSGKEELQDCQIAKRIFYFTNKETGEERVIPHFHYEGWPNKKAAPDQELFNELVTVVDAVNRDSKAPIVVHCAAGRGRAGTFVTSHVTKIQLGAMEKEEEARLNIASTLMQGRLQRDGFVETKDQMKTIYNAALHFS
ncbi:MAG: dual specificity protein phosphatase family protein [Verrucomicrobia bacterium]|nr:dual specificity protein phosphatase family protein [Verrucomicrobiota bacterium]